MDFTELRDAVGLVKAREDDVVIAMAAHRDATAMAMACAEETLLDYLETISDTDMVNRVPEGLAGYLAAAWAAQYTWAQGSMWMKFTSWLQDITRLTGWVVDWQTSTEPNPQADEVDGDIIINLTRGAY